MTTDVTFAREETTERRTLSGAEAAAHNAQANRFARKTDPHTAPQLLRVPRASVPPLPEGRTQLTPAPVFDDEVELLEDSGLLTLVAENAESIEELSARFLIDEEAREVHQMPLRASHRARLPAPPGSDELAGMDEIDSAHLAFVETKGEIRSESPVTNYPKIRLVSLHEKALADGIAQYSDGVPCHDLEGGGQISRTLRVRAPRRESHASPWRHLPVLLVFAAGIGAGTYFALKNTGSSTSPVAAAAGTDAPLPMARATGPAGGAPETANALIAEPVVAEPVVAEPVVAEPVVAEPVVAEPVVLPLTAEMALSGVQVMPLPASNEANHEAPGLTGGRAEKGERGPSPAPAETSRAPARAKGSPSRPGGSQPVTGTADPGVLMLAAKPPCSIRIDGKDTGLVTPQRVLKLSPGKHKIVLVNEEHGLKDSFVVSIQSGERTRVIRDNTSKIR